MEAQAKSTSILNLVNKTLELPTLPEVLVKLNETMANPDSSADDVAKVIQADPAVSANILRIVNSAYYGLQVRVSSVNLAVSIMGFNMTKKVALKAAVFSVFGKKKDKVPHFDPTAFWKHSIYTGVAARVLGSESPRFTGTHAEDLYVCGLLHDIGKIILLESATKKYASVLEQAGATGHTELQVENEVLGFNHADVGSVLAIKWFLPEDLTIAIRYHHAPTKDPFHKSLSSLIHLADHLAWSAGKPSTQGLPRPTLESEVYQQVGLDPKQVEGLLPQVQQDFEATGLPF
ncbi:MAG: HDOD domain-containing protein [Planctomycetes bacterium]|nr:HDOD domain-containing protein [Planctomycetota bacterium]